MLPTPAPWARASPAAAMAQDLTGDADEEAAPTLADRLAAVRVRLAAVRPFTDFASKVAELEGEEKALVEAERADRPLPRRLQSAMDTLRDRENKASKSRSSADTARATWEAAETYAAETGKEESAAREALTRIEKEVSDAARASAPPAMDVDAVKNALDSVVAACSAVLMPSDAVSATALVDQLRAALNASASAAAVASGAGATPGVAPVGASVHAGGLGAGAALADGSEQLVGGDGARTRPAAKRPPPAAARTSGRRGTSPAMASCESDDEEDGRSRSRERRETERKEADRLDQERTSRDVVEGRQRTIGDALSRGAT